MEILIYTTILIVDKDEMGDKGNTFDILLYIVWKELHENYCH